MRPRGWSFVLAVAAVAFLCDFVTKRYVESHMYIGQVSPVIPGVFDIAYIRNTGAAFSILEGRTAFLIVVSVGVLAFVAVYGRSIIAMGPAASWGVGLVVGGAVGNLVDRVRYGGVADFLYIHHWPVFNLADSAMVVGGALVAWTLLRESRDAEEGDDGADGGEAGPDGDGTTVEARARPVAADPARSLEAGERS